MKLFLLFVFPLSGVNDIAIALYSAEPEDFECRIFPGKPYLEAKILKNIFF